MAFATSDDGVRLYYEETGSGSPIIFVHEFAGDHRSSEKQLQHFGRRYRAITYAARGYPPSDVPEDPASYSQNRAADDILVVLDHLGIQKAHVCGLSMGGFATLHFGLRHPSRALSLCVAGCGYGAELNMREQLMGRPNSPGPPDSIALLFASIRSRSTLRRPLALVSII
jgi:pimeloyl-ACP methyl ester carboxylesterase